MTPAEFMQMTLVALDADEALRARLGMPIRLYGKSVVLEALRDVDRLSGLVTAGMIVDELFDDEAAMQLFLYGDSSYPEPKGILHVAKVVERPRPMTKGPPRRNSNKWVSKAERWA